MSDYYPVVLNLRGKRCVVVGGGRVAERKVYALLECGALVTVVSPTLAPGLHVLAEKKQISFFSRNYRKGDLKDAVLAIATTNYPEVNRNVFDEGQSKGVLVNVVDEPHRSNFLVPSVLRRGDLLIAVSTGGKSPALSRRIREELEETYEAEYATLVTLIAEVRMEMQNRGIEIASDEWQSSLKVSDILQRLRNNEYEVAKHGLITDLEASDHRSIQRL